jgi:hypothetical protein
MTKFRLLLIIVFAGIMTGCRAQLALQPLKIPFHLHTSGYVTLVIEKQDSTRLRNLLAETWFDKGDHTVFWDGLDDLGRDVDAAHHGLYSVPGKTVAPGTYRVRGLVHPEIRVTYEFPIYSAGKTPWNTKDHTGGWLANHSAPQAAVFVPAAQSPVKQPVVFLGSFVTEGPDGVAWVDLKGTKLGGKKWIGGSWTAAPFMARDAGTEAAANVAVYVASVWETQKGSGKMELRISSIPKSDQPIIRYELPGGAGQTNKNAVLKGIAVHNGIAVISLTNTNQLLFADLKTGKVTGSAPVGRPGGIFFDSSGKLLVLSGTQLLKYKNVHTASDINAPELLITKGLEDPVGITVSATGDIYISDAGKSHQVKVFTADGDFLRVIGKAGAPSAGIYDPLHMNNPAGITIDEKQQLWVTENDFLPKRVSLWSLDGKLLNAFYGPAKYGGGGTLDPENKNSFYYAEEARGAMEFKLDWELGRAVLSRVIYRQDAAQLELPDRSAAPETPLYHLGKRYFSNCFNSSPTGGSLTAVLFAERNGIAFPAAAMGNAASWPALHADPRLKQFFIWSDLNADAKVQAAEVSYSNGSAGGVTIMADLSFCVTNYNGKALQFTPVSFNSQGIPSYNFAAAKILATGVQGPASSGGNQVLAAPGGWSVLSLGIKPYSTYSLSGTKDGKPMWSYPDLWPGLHASHEAPIPSSPAELIGTTRMLGNHIGGKTGDLGPLFAINSNHGMVYLFTADGLFVTALFEPMRGGKPWTMPVAERGMDLKGLSLGEENFWPSLTQTKEGEVFLADGSRSSLLKVEGLDQIQRLPATTIRVTAEDLKKISAGQKALESERQSATAVKPLKVLTVEGLKVDGLLSDWGKADWVDIDKRGVKAYFNAKTTAYNITAAVGISDGRLFAAYRTGDASVLKNSGEMESATFKTGGALDLMIGTNPSADPKRSIPVEGDLRLLVTLIHGKPKAVLYRPVVPGTLAGVKVPFSSPWRTVTMDEVKDITSELQFAADAKGNYEYSVPLSALHLKPVPGLMIKGDIGLLRGDGTETLSRSYWNNKGTSIVSDVPSEAELTPGLWGNWLF